VLGYTISSGGTDNHVLLVDLRSKGINGLEAQEALDKAAITVNKNAIPFDTEPISKTGGIRLGTPAMTTRGFKEEEMMQVADFIHTGLQARNDDATLSALRREVTAFTARFPLP
jgi:glycine hydroxymethyltransferase